MQTHRPYEIFKHNAMIQIAFSIMEIQNSII
jgi:hypothetical protein